MGRVCELHSVGLYSRYVMLANLSPQKPQSGTGEKRVRPWASLAFPNYRLLWTAALLSTVGLQMRQFANVWQVYELTGSPLKLGLTGLFQALPLFTIGLFAGTITDMMDRRKLLIASQAANLFLALALGLLTYSGAIQVWHIYVITALTSAVNIFGQPARVALIPATVPKTHLMNAITLNQVIQQGAQLVGPTLAGLIVASAGPATAYFVNTALFIPSVATLAIMRLTNVTPTASRGFRLSAVREGMSFVWSTPILVGLILLDTVATLFGSYRSLTPVLAKEVLHVGPAALGALFSAPALGAVAGTMVILTLGNVQRKGLMVLLSTFSYAGTVALYGVSQWLSVSLVLAGALGLLDSVGVSARQTTFQLLSPENMRGRTASIQQMFAMGAPSLGYVLAGTTASLITAPLTLVLGGFIIASAVGLVALRNKDIREYRT